MTKLPPGREPPPQMRQIPVERITVDLETGVEKHDSVPWKLMPPKAHLCQVCAVDHDPLIPHNQQSMYYQMAFHAAQRRYPTWADAVAHCDPEIQEQWRVEIKKRNRWTEPPEGVEPVKHFGD